MLPCTTQKTFILHTDDWSINNPSEVCFLSCVCFCVLWLEAGGFCRADTLIHHGQIRLQTLFSGPRPAGKSSCCRVSAVIHLQSFCCDKFCPQQAAAAHVAAHDIPVLSETAKARWEFSHQLVVCAIWPCTCESDLFYEKCSLWYFECWCFSTVTWSIQITCEEKSSCCLAGRKEWHGRGRKARYVFHRLSV